MGWKGPSCAGKAGCPLAWEQGQGVGISHFAGRLSCFLAEGERAEIKKRTQELRWQPLTGSAIGSEGPIPLLIGNPKQSESVLVIGLQWGDHR